MTTNQPKQSIFRRFANYFENLTILEKVLFLFNILVIIGVLIYQCTSTGYINSDTASIILLGKEIHDSGSLFPHSWQTAGELPAFGLQTIIAVLFSFMDDYMLMFKITSVLFIFITIASLIFFSVKALKNNAWLLAIPLIICSRTQHYMEIVFGQCAYLLSILYIFLILGLYLKSTDDDFRIISKPMFIAAMLLLALRGLNGLRPIQEIGLPMLGALALMFYIRYYKDKEFRFRKKAAPYFINALLLVVTIGIGFVGNKLCTSLLDANSNIISGYTIFSSVDQISDSVLNVVHHIVEMLGLNLGIPLMSVNGVLSIIKFVFGILVLIVIPVLQIKKFHQESKNTQFYILFTLVHIGEILLLDIFCGALMNTERYTFSSQYLLLFMSANYIYKYWLKDSALLMKITALATVGLLTIPGAYSNVSSLWASKDSVQNLKNLESFLEENGLDFGYATYWNAYVNTVLSNGKVEINSVSVTPNLITAHNWLCSTEWYTQEHHSGTSFLMLTSEEKQVFENSTNYLSFNDPERVLTYNDYTIYVYDYNISKDNFAGNLTRSILDSMVSLGEEPSSDNYTLNPGELWYGPYWQLPADSYTITIESNNDDQSAISYTITDNCGETVIQSGEISGSENKINVTLSEPASNFELVLNNTLDHDIQYSSIIITKAS